MSMVQAVRGPDVARPATGDVARPSKGLPVHVREVDSVEGLALIWRPGINLAFWPRALPAEVVTHLPAMVSAGLAPVRCEVSSDALDAELRHRLPPGPCRDWLTTDAALLARTLAQIAGTRRVVLRIEAIAGDACRLSTPMPSRRASSRLMRAAGRNGSRMRTWRHTATVVTSQRTASTRSPPAPSRSSGACAA